MLGDKILNVGIVVDDIGDRGAPEAEAPSTSTTVSASPSTTATASATCTSTAQPKSGIKPKAI